MASINLQNTTSFLQSEERKKRKDSSFEDPAPKRFAIDKDVAATTIQQAYRAYRHRVAIQPESYEAVEQENFSDTQWEKLKTIASDLQKKGYNVFAHGSRFPEHALFTDIRSYLASENPAFDRSWNTKRVLRSPNIPLLFKNTQEYFASDTCMEINIGIQTDHYPNSRDMLSVDGYLDNRLRQESAYDFYSRNENIFQLAHSHIGDFLGEYIKNPSAMLFFYKVINQWMLKYNSRWQLEGDGIAEPFTQGQGRVYLIAIAKEILENPELSYIWRSHPFGCVCTCNGEHTSDRFISLLEGDQKGEITKCNGWNPQYRILTANLGRDSTSQVLAFDSITAAQKKIYQDFMLPMALLMKNFRQLESLSETSSYEEIVTTLLRVRFVAPYLIEKIDQDIYEKGLVGILREKIILLAKYHHQLEKDLPEEFFDNLDKLELLDDLRNTSAEFLCRLLLNSPDFQKIDLVTMYRGLRRIRNFDAVQSFMEVCSDGSNPKCAISKEEILHKAIKERDGFFIKALIDAQIFTYRAVACASMQVASESVTGRFRRIFFS